MGATHRVRSSPAGGAPTGRFFLRPDHFPVLQLRLADDLPKVPVSSVTDTWFLGKLSAFGLVDVEEFPVVVYDFFDLGQTIVVR